MSLRRNFRLPRTLRQQAARISVVLLVLLLAFTQHAAVVHALDHFVALAPQRLLAAGSPGAVQAAAPAPLRAGLSAPVHGTGNVDAYCDKCYQFAHLSGIAVGQVGLLVLPRAMPRRSLNLAATAFSADPPRAQSRGPPNAL